MNTLLIIRGDYGWKGGERYAEEGLAHLRNVFRRSADIKPEIFTQIERDRLKHQAK